MGLTPELLEAAEQNDKRLKKIFSHRAVLARLIQFVDEKAAKEFTFEELCSVLGERKRSNSKQAVEPYILSQNLESQAIYGKELRFDLLTTIPFSDEAYDLCTLNLEFQSKQYPGYDLHNRALAYYCRLMDDIINAGRGDAAYRNVHRVMSIWIVSSSQNKLEHFKIRDVAGSSMAMDFMDIVMLYVDDSTTIEATGLFDFVRNLVNPAGDAMSRLAQYLPATCISGEEVSSMEGFTRGMLENAYEKGEAKGIQEGIQKGREQGRAEGVEDGILSAAIAMLENGMAVDEIVRILDGDQKMREHLEAYRVAHPVHDTTSVVPKIELDK